MQTIRKEDPSADAIVTWTAHPMRENWWKGVVFWSLIIFLVWVIYWNVESIFWTVILSTILIWSQADFYLKTAFRLDSDGAEMKRGMNRKRIKWKKVRSTSDHENGLLLSPYISKSWLEQIRGIKLYYRNNREEVIEMVENFTKLPK